MENNNYKQFDRFLAREMSKAERTSFEVQLHTEEELNYHFQLFKAACETVIKYPVRKETEAIVTSLLVKIEEENAARFHRYLNGQMLLVERLDLEAEMVENPWLAYSFKKLEQLPPSVVTLAPNGKSVEFPLAMHRLSYFLLKIAATFLVLCSLGWWLFQQNRQGQLTALAKEYDFIRPDADWGEVSAMASESGAPSAEQLKSEGLSAYAAGNLDKAVALLEQYMAVVPQNDAETWMLALYTGRCYLEKGDFRRAVSTFEAAEAHLQEPSYALLLDHVRWQKALALLRMGKLQSTKKELQVLSQEATHQDIKTKSAQLLKELL